eukprot:6187306-Pleurochrysis_carterae.AAC.1
MRKDATPRAYKRGEIAGYCVSELACTVDHKMKTERKDCKISLEAFLATAAKAEDSKNVDASSAAENVPLLMQVTAQIIQAGEIIETVSASEDDIKRDCLNTRSLRVTHQPMRYAAKREINATDTRKAMISPQVSNQIHPTTKATRGRRRTPKCPVAALANCVCDTQAAAASAGAGLRRAVPWIATQKHLPPGRDCADAS